MHKNEYTSCKMIGKIKGKIYILDISKSSVQEIDVIIAVSHCRRLIYVWDGGFYVF